MENLDTKNGRILIIDDERGNIKILERFLKAAGYTQVKSVLDSRKAVNAYIEFLPDLVLLDLKMPNLDGFQVMEQLKNVDRSSYLPVLVLTAQRDHPTRMKALELGAKDFLTKPFDMAETILRIQNMLEVRMLHNKINEQNHLLEGQVKERTKQLEATRLEVIHRLGRAAEYRDNETGLHVIRMSHLCVRLAREVGMTEKECQLLLQASPMHDVGKIGIPDQILLKPGALNEEEWEIMRLHPLIGAEILSGSDSELMKMAETISLTHQERWDGKGYPFGLKGQEIPLAGRIVAVCDVFDALTSKRPYKEAFSINRAMEMIEEKSGIDFEPKLVTTFKRILPDMVEIVDQFSDQDQRDLIRAFNPTAH
jgi:putative two-component system response regulator